MPGPYRQIALCLHASSSFQTAMARGLADWLGDHAVWSVQIRHVKPGGLAATLTSWRGDGVICSVNTLAEVEFARSLGAAVVNVSGALEEPDLPSVIGDDSAAGEVAAEHLLERGYVHFATIGHDQRHFGRAREAAFVARVAEAGGRVHARVRGEALFERMWAEQIDLLGETLGDLPRPAAVFAVFDPLAHLAIDACLQSGLAVPGDVAVLGVDNDPLFCSLSAVPLSSVSQRFDRRGYEAAALLDRLMDGAAPPEAPIRVAPDAVIARRSTAAFAVDDGYVRAALAHIAAHTADTLSVDDVAKATHMSRRTLERRFKAALGRTVYDEIRRVRLATAKAGLTDTDDPILQIAMDAGFCSSADLANAFRRHVGMTPTEYRRRFRRD